MQRVILIPAAITLGILAPQSLAEDFWIKKTYLEWNDKEIQKILNDSPWSKQAGSASNEPAARGGPSTGVSDASESRGIGRGSPSGLPGGVRGAGVPRGSGGEASSRSGANPSGSRAPTNAPAVKLLVQWISALPVKQAMVRLRFGKEAASSGEAMQILEREELGYVLTLNGIPPALSQVDPAQLREALRNASSLNRKDREAIRPSEVQVAGTEDGGIVAVLVFPKADPITPDDKEVEFVTKLGSREFRCKFVLRDMISGGKLQL